MFIYLFESLLITFYRMLYISIPFCEFSYVTHFAKIAIFRLSFSFTIQYPVDIGKLDFQP